MDNELILFDRLNIIRDVVNKYGEENFYISFSGGKDSTILHYIIDEAIPNNKIPRVFINTGIEYNDIVKFVKEIQKKDDRIVIVNSNINIPKMLERVGYPFKSKEHAKKLGTFQNSGLCKSVNVYISDESKLDKCKFVCPDVLKYQFSDDFNIKISDKCCNELKKKVAHKYEKDSRKRIAIIGLRMSEGGARAERSSCVVFDSKSKELRRFKPLNPCNDDFCEWYMKERNIKLCKLYYEPYSFQRTGCKGCPFSINLADQLEIMERLLPAERKQCEYIWKPVYNEYRRLGYRLKKNEQSRLF